MDFTGTIKADQCLEDKDSWWFDNGCTQGDHDYQAYYVIPELS